MSNTLKCKRDSSSLSIAFRKNNLIKKMRDYLSTQRKVTSNIASFSPSISLKVRIIHKFRT